MSKRLAKELMKLKKKKLDWMDISVDDSEIYKWDVAITGPDKTPYEGGSFNVKLEFPMDYPFKAPKVTFTTKIYSPHVRKDTGAICEGLLGDWSPTNNALTSKEAPINFLSADAICELAYSIQTSLHNEMLQVLMKLRTIMEDPSSDAPVEPAIGEQYAKNREAFDKEARKWTKKYAQ